MPASPSRSPATASIDPSGEMVTSFRQVFLTVMSVRFKSSRVTDGEDGPPRIQPTAATTMAATATVANPIVILFHFPSVSTSIAGETSCTCDANP